MKVRLENFLILRPFKFISMWMDWRLSPAQYVKPNTKWPLKRDSLPPPLSLSSPTTKNELGL